MDYAIADLERSRRFHEENPVPLEIQAAEEDLDRLGDRIVELSARIQVATYHLLVLIREFDQRHGWGGGFLSCAHWLNWRTGLTLGAAREKVRVARALSDLPRIAEAFGQGKVSYSKVRAMTRVARPDNEGELLDFALAGTAAHVERLVRGWRLVNRIEEGKQDAARLAHRSICAYWAEDGMLVVRGRLDPETGAVLMRALDAAAERLYQRDREAQLMTCDDASHEQRRADALGLVAESALAADLDRGAPGERFLVALHVDAAVLPEATTGEERPGMALLEDAVGVSAETSRRLSCDCATVTITRDGAGTVLDVGRKRRTISPALRRALAFRDRTCRFPGCGVRACDGHHVKHWADGGETRLDNLLLLCRRHHRAVHEEGYRVELQPDGGARFFSPYGWEILPAPALPAGVVAEDDPLLLDFTAEHGVAVGARTGSATCYAGRCEYWLAIDAMRTPRPPAPVALVREAPAAWTTFPRKRRSPSGVDDPARNGSPSIRASASARRLLSTPLPDQRLGVAWMAVLASWVRGRPPQSQGMRSSAAIPGWRTVRRSTSLRSSGVLLG